jgi:hypothetical protein
VLFELDVPDVLFIVPLLFMVPDVPELYVPLFVEVFVEVFESIVPVPAVVAVLSVAVVLPVPLVPLTLVLFVDGVVRADEPVP